MNDENIGFRGDNIIPAVYQNSLAYYELLKAFCDKLNEVIDVVNKGGGGGGGTGEDGATFIPYVSPEGIISWTNNKSLPNPKPVDIKGPAGADGTDGTDGENGATFTPSVSSAGVISWTNDKDLPNPESVNIKGPAGADGTDGENGATFTPSVSSSGVISWTNDKELPNPQSVNLTIPMFIGMCSIIIGSRLITTTTSGNFVYVANSTIFARPDGFYILNTDKLINSTVYGNELDTIQDDRLLNELVSTYRTAAAQDVIDAGLVSAVAAQNLSNAQKAQARANIATIDAESIAEIEYSPVTQAHAVGDYIVWNYQLYKVTAAISLGENLILGTNIERANISNAVGAYAAEVIETYTYGSVSISYNSATKICFLSLTGNANQPPSAQTITANLPNYVKPLIDVLVVGHGGCAFVDVHRNGSVNIGLNGGPYCYCTAIFPIE